MRCLCFAVFTETVQSSSNMDYGYSTGRFPYFLCIHCNFHVPIKLFLTLMQFANYRGIKLNLLFEN